MRSAVDIGGLESLRAKGGRSLNSVVKPNFPKRHELFANCILGCEQDEKISV